MNKRQEFISCSFSHFARESWLSTALQRTVDGSIPSQSQIPVSRCTRETLTLRIRAHFFVWNFLFPILKGFAFCQLAFTAPIFREPSPHSVHKLQGIRLKAGFFTVCTEISGKSFMSFNLNKWLQLYFIILLCLTAQKPIAKRLRLPS